MIVDSSLQLAYQRISIAQLIAVHPAKFVMTGSRSFSGARVLPSTDVDLFVNEDELELSTLHEWGFEVISDESYTDDPTMATVYRCQCRIEDKQYDIQMIPASHFQAKLHAQRILEQFFRSDKAYQLNGFHNKRKRKYSDYSKTERYALWELVIMMVETGLAREA